MALSSAAIYKKIGFSFIALAVILVIAIVYFSFSEATIIITPAPEKISVEFLARIISEADLADYQGETPAVAGGVYEKTVRGRQTFEVTSDQEVEAQAVGRVTIINNYGKAQSLVATTRLLTPDGLLFRLSKRVDAPAGGKVEVEVYADQPGKQGEIGPTKFTVPGLWEGLQDKIYAESYEPMTGGLKKTAAVTQADFDRAVKELSDNLFGEALAAIKNDFGDDLEINPENTIREVGGQKFSAQIGDQTGEFTAEITLRVVAVMADRQALLLLAEDKLKADAPADKELGGIDPRSFRYSVERYDLDNKMAEVNVYLAGGVALREDSLLLDKDKLAGLTKEEAEQYFAGLAEIAKAEIKFSPFWVDKIPDLQDHIKININYNETN